MTDKLIDLECKGCGKSFEPDARENVTVTKMENGSVMYTQNDEPVMLTCPYCQKKAMIFKPAPTTNGSNVLIKVNGSVTNSNFISGNGNTIIRR